MSARPQAVFTLDALKKSWLKAKADEREANERRVAIEKRMLSMLGSLVPQEGTFNQDGLTISTGYTRKWDQAKLTTLAVCIDQSYWPFSHEWKEDRKASRVFETRFPDLWKHVASALTLTPAKPAVKVED